MGDDALYKLYHTIIPLSLQNSRTKLVQLKEEYPFSAYAAEQNTAIEEKPIVKEKPSVCKTKRNNIEICN